MYQNMLSRLTLLLFFLLAAENVCGNGLQITNVERLSPPNRNQVRFNVSWENSWNVEGAPANHDAVWLFVKFRDCNASPADAWNHALLSPTMADHSVGAELAFAKPISTTDRNGDSSGHNTGVLIRRASIGTGNITTGNEVTLTLVGSSQGVAFDPATDYDVKVLGIEMVQVKEGEFFMGDGVSRDRISRNSSNRDKPFRVTAEGHFGYNFYEDGRNNSCNDCLPEHYPMGFDAFYCMKYEITQGQYVDFLNTIGQFATNHYHVPNSTPEYRYEITVNTGSYQTPRPERVMGHIGTDAFFAFLDWAALRPMSEFEYEKAARGLSPVAPHEYAWGNSSYTKLDTLTDGPELGSELALNNQSDVNVHFGRNEINKGGDRTISTNRDYTEGPVSAGLFARNRDNLVTQNGYETRQSSGASYWGIMELTGNVYEQVISVGDGTNGNNPQNGFITDTAGYTAIWGDGMLDTTSGNHNVPRWGNITGLRGGSWYEFRERQGRISNREECEGRNVENYDNEGPSNRGDIGGRGVR